MNKSSFLIVGQHAVIEALRNPNRKVLKVFLTEESKKNIHRKNPKKNVLEDVKVFFKSKKELDKYTSKDQIMHGGYIAEVEHVDQPDLKEFIKGKNKLPGNLSSKTFLSKWSKCKFIWSLSLPAPRPSLISISIERLTTSLDAKSFAFGAYLSINLSPLPFTRNPPSPLAPSVIKHPTP